MGERILGLDKLARKEVRTLKEPYDLDLHRITKRMGSAKNSILGRSGVWLDNIYRVDRSRKKKRRGRNSGGVAIYIKNDCSPEILLEYSSEVIDALCIKILHLELK